jgi:hypothetical protein
MKIIKQNWFNLALVASAGVVVLTLLMSDLVWGQTLPGLSIVVSPTNQISLTVTNGSGGGQYQIYFTEFLDSESVDWTLFTNGTVGQTNFYANMGDFEQGFFKAVNNTNFIAPSINVIIQSPANGSLVY